MSLVQGYDRLLIDYKITHCLNHCVFCHMGDEVRNTTPVPFAKLKSIVGKLVEWKKTNAPADFKMFIVSGTWDHDDIVEIIKLDKRVRDSSEGSGVMLGGMKHRTESDMLKWLESIKAAGAGWVGMTFWGPQELHDSWCGRRGEYDFNVMAARLAAKIGLSRRESVLLTKSSIPNLDELMEMLDAIPGPKKRCIFPLNYGGRAKKLEHERLTKAEFEALPDRITKDLRTADLKTEKEWMKFIKQEWDPSQITRIMRLPVDKSNVDKLIAMTASEILTFLRNKHDQLYQAVPDFQDISQKYGNPFNDKIYSLLDVDTLWSESYFRDNPKPDLPELKNRPFLSIKKIIDYEKLTVAMKLLDELDFQMFSLFSNSLLHRGLTGPDKGFIS